MGRCSFSSGRPRPTFDHAQAIRAMLKERFATLAFYFVPADATAQTLAGSAQADFEVRVIGRDASGNAEIARDLAEAMRAIPGSRMSSPGRCGPFRPIIWKSTGCVRCSLG